MVRSALDVVQAYFDGDEFIGNTEGLRTPEDLRSFDPILTALDNRVDESHGKARMTLNELLTAYGKALDATKNDAKLAGTLQKNFFNRLRSYLKDKLPDDVAMPKVKLKREEGENQQAEGEEQTSSSRHFDYSGHKMITLYLEKVFKDFIDDYDNSIAEDDLFYVGPPLDEFNERQRQIAEDGMGIDPDRYVTTSLLSYVFIRGAVRDEGLHWSFAEVPQYPAGLRKGVILVDNSEDVKEVCEAVNVHLDLPLYSYRETAEQIPKWTKHGEEVRWTGDDAILVLHGKDNFERSTILLYGEV